MSAVAQTGQVSSIDLLAIVCATNPTLAQCFTN